MPKFPQKHGPIDVVLHLRPQWLSGEGQMPRTCSVLLSAHVCSALMHCWSQIPLAVSPLRVPPVCCTAFSPKRLVPLQVVVQMFTSSEPLFNSSI